MTRWLLLVLILAAATASLLLMGGNPTPEPDPAPIEDRGPDYWMENSHIERFDEDGQRILTLDAERLSHYPARAETTLSQPRLAQQGPMAVQWRINARHGLIQDDRSRIDLSGDVHMQRVVAQGPLTELFTDRLRVFPQRELAETELAVRLERGPSLTTGIGLTADMGSDRLQIHDEVRTRYVPEND